jgi:protocatechuate 3,4-dioxygenase beta subunit
MPRKLMTNRRFSRRETFRLIGAAGATALVGPTIAGKPAAAQDAGPSCVVTPALTEGPYFVDEKLNRSDIRVDPTDNTMRPGVPLRLKMTVYRIDSGACTPLTGATVDVWHCDALGLYSDVQSEGSAGKKFLRGYQVTDEKGAAEFITIYPGWYRGRAVHVHFKARLYAGSQKTYEFTSQFFFDEAITDIVYAQAPYNTKGTRDTKNSTDGIFRQPVNDGSGKLSGELLLVQLTNAEQGQEGYVGTFAMGLRLT